MEKRGIPIKTNTWEYRQWKAQQNRKNLLRRTRRNKILKARRTAQIQHRLAVVREDESIERSFLAPKVFSFIENPEGTVQYFDELTSFITNKENFGKKLFIDLCQIEIISIDALMYLLACINNINRNIKNNFRFAGNIPNDPRIQNLIKDSGFFRFVRYLGNEPMSRNVDNIQIISDDKVMTRLAKQIADFLLSKGNLTRKACSFLYNMMIELMSNAHNHAYNDKNCLLYPRWYCFAEHNADTNIVSFTFMDTGEGIPSTVRKRFYEHLDFMNLKGEDEYVVSALKGELRSETYKPNRGKGLPAVLEACQQSQIKYMRIISNKADVALSDATIDSRELAVSLKGTLLYWQIDISELFEVVQNG